jgi:GATA-binding protein, other eukaryote
MLPSSNGAVGAGTGPRDKMDISAADKVVRTGLYGGYFPAWKESTAGEELDSPIEMQRKDLLAI